MRSVYTAQITLTGVSAAKTLLYGTNGSSNILEILSANVTDENQVNPEQLIIAINRVTTAGSPAGTSNVNVNKTEKSSSSTVVTWLSNLTTEPTTYDSDYIDRQGSTNMAGYYYDCLPETRKYIPPSGAFGLRLLNSPVNSLTLTIQLTYREIG